MTCSRISACALLSICALLFIGGIASAHDETGPRISHSYPPPEDIRSPDRTLAEFGPGPVRLLAYSPDGRALIAAGADNKIRVFDARTGEQGTGELLRTLEGQQDRILAIKFSADNKSLISIGNEGAINTSEIATGKLRRSTQLGFITDDAKHDRIVAFRPGTEVQLLESAGNRLLVRDYETGVTGHDIAPRLGTISAAIFSPDGKRLIYGTSHGLISNLSVDGGPQGAFGGGNSAVTTLAAGASEFVAGYADGTVNVCSLKPDIEQPIHKIKAHGGSVTAISIRGDQFATAGNDKLAKVWDLATGKLLCTQQGHTSPVLSVVINGSHGQKMATGATEGIVKYWTIPLPPIPPADLEKIEAALPEKATATPKQPRKLLVFWRADAILHKGGVPAANKAIERLGQKTGAYTADFTRDYEALEPAVLVKYDGLVMNSTAHLAIPESAKHALVDFAKSGKGVIGIHAAIDTFHDWPEGAGIIGATFGGHPWTPSGTWAVKLDEPEHPLLQAWGGKNFKMHDEIYELAAPYSRADRRVLMSLDLSDAATAGVSPLHRQDKDFAVSWIKRFGEGRVFFCMFGHIGQPFQNPAVLKYYLDGIQYALGDLAVDDTPRP